MIGYVTLGTNDIDKARAYYDALLGSIGAKQVMTLDRGFTYYAIAPDQPGFAITPPYDGAPATAGNGNMTAISIGSRAAVDAFHALALELGGTDEGAPGLRSPEGPGAFYIGYFRDPEGNKLCAVHVGGAG